MINVLSLMRSEVVIDPLEQNRSRRTYKRRVSVTEDDFVSTYIDSLLNYLNYKYTCYMLNPDLFSKLTKNPLLTLNLKDVWEDLYPSWCD